MVFKIDTAHKEMIVFLARHIADSGGRALFVGGVVRDRLLGRKPKDIDVEVYGLSLEQLEQILGEQGKVILVGRQFGVLRLMELDVDWSVPRRDSRGRHPVVEIDPSMSPKEASRRRDLTMNAMLQDVITDELIDPWGGQKDMDERTLRTPDTKLFVEDPLRFYRVMQFAARFEMVPSKELNEVCAQMDISHVSVERVEEEFAKLFLEAARPSLGLRWLEKVGRLVELFPELTIMKGTPQEPDWHPEGDVWRHTLQVVDAAAALRTGNRERDLMLMWAALLHDIGKPATTTERAGRIRTPEHDREGETLARSVLERVVKKQSVIKGTVKLVAQHMKPLQFYQNKSSEKAFKRLAVKLAPEADLELLAALALADCRGVNPQGEIPLEIESRMVNWFLEMARDSRVNKKPEKPVLTGRHLKGIIEPGPGMGEVLEAAYRIQLEEGIKNVEELKRRAFEEVGRENSE